MSKLYVFPLSDLHLEFDDQDVDSLIPQIPKTFDIDKDTSLLVIAGDLSYPSKKSFVNFLTKCKTKFNIVIFVPGNHEYYKQGTSIDLVDQRIKQLCDQAGCIFLQKNTHTTKLRDDRVVQIAGCTYWSKIRDENKLILSAMLNDFQQIISPFSKKLLSCNCYNILHNDHHQWLSKELVNVPDIVVTHHLVSTRLVHKDYIGSPINDGFASSDLTEKELQIPKLWICGHTHKHMNVTLENGTRLLTNPVGYKDETSNFDRTLHIII